MTKVSDALAVFDQSNALIKYALSETALIMPDGCDFTTVERMLQGFKIVGDATKFWRGDLLVYAQRNFGEMYSQLVDDSDYAFQTLKDEMWVSNSVAPATRRAELSWSHHREVAALTRQEQIKWLALAVEQKLTQQTLRSLIRGGVEKDAMPSKSAVFEGALKAILKNSMDSEFFSEKFYNERLEDSEGISPPMLVVTRAAIIAGDALKVYQKTKQ